MAMPIHPTPTLVGEDAARFLSQVEANLQKPLKRTTPLCLEAAKNKVLEYVRNSEKKYSA